LSGIGGKHELLHRVIRLRDVFPSGEQDQLLSIAKCGWDGISQGKDLEYVASKRYISKHCTGEDKIGNTVNSSSIECDNNMLCFTSLGQICLPGR
jgi:hypothetical protein